MYVINKLFSKIGIKYFVNSYFTIYNGLRLKLNG